MKKRNLRTISIVECDEKGIITQVDKAMVLMYGYKDDEILGKKVTTLFTEESKPRFNDHLAAYTVNFIIYLYFRFTSFFFSKKLKFNLDQ